MVSQILLSMAAPLSERVCVLQWCEETRGCMHWASVLDAVCILKASN